MIPRWRLMILAACALPVLVAGIWMPPLRDAAVIVNLALICLATADGLMTAPLKKLRVSREVSETLSVGTRNPVRLIIRNFAQEPVTVELFDETPRPGSATRQPITLCVPPGAERAGTYAFQPVRRGNSEFSAVYLRTASRFGLWTLLERRELRSPVRILPDIRSVYRYELMARRNRVAELGIKMSRLRGRGSEFERLRDYRREDELRQIDWKATARNQRLISREFNIERNQNVLVAVDCGRSMLNESDGISYLDRALNASLMLCYIALGQADNVGFMAFSSRVERAVKPREARHPDGAATVVRPRRTPRDVRLRAGAGTDDAPIPQAVTRHTAHARAGRTASRRNLAAFAVGPFTAFVPLRIPAGFGAHESGHTRTGRRRRSVPVCGRCRTVDGR